jgi:hypothetical protein
MDVQATGEAFSPQKRTPSTSKHEISSLFSILVGLFYPLRSDPDPAEQSQCGSGSATLAALLEYPCFFQYIILPV